jgi:hypothetical protein
MSVSNIGLIFIVYVILIFSDPGRKFFKHNNKKLYVSFDFIFGFENFYILNRN